MGWMSRAALEYISQGGLGYSFDALEETNPNSYSEELKRFSQANFTLLLPRQMLPFLVKFGTPGLRRAVLELLPFQATKTIVSVSDVMDKMSRQIFQGKKEALAKGDEAVKDQVGKGKDIMSVLSELPNCFSRFGNSNTHLESESEHG